MWLIAKKEFLLNLLSFRFATGFILCVILIPLSVHISIKHYEERRSIYSSEREECAEQMRRLYTYSYIRPTILRPPEPLSIFNRGIESTLGNRVRIQLGQVPFLAEGALQERGNPLLASFLSIDFSFIVTVLFSLMALLFTYDAISGEKERGSLRGILANKLSRDKLLLGKLLGNILTLLPIITVSFVAGLLLILISRKVEFQQGEWVRLGGLFLVTFLYMLLFMLVGMFISTRTHSSTTSLMVSLFLWVLLVVVVPVAAPYLAQSLTSVTPRETVDQAAAELNREFRAKVREYEETLPEPEWDISFGGYHGFDGAHLEVASPRDVMENQRLIHSFQEPLRIEYADRKWRIQQTYLDGLLHQQRLAQRLGWVSPASVFMDITSGLTTTDVSSYLHFMQLARRYRDQIIDYYQSRNLFSSYAYFAQQKEEEMKSLDELIYYVTEGRFSTYEELSEGRDFWGVVKEFTRDLPRAQDLPYLEIKDIPQFSWQREGLSNFLKGSLTELSIMVFVPIVLFLLGYVSFIKYDPR